MGVGNKGLEVFDEEERMNTGSKYYTLLQNKQQIYDNTQATVVQICTGHQLQNFASQTNYACITLH